MNLPSPSVTVVVPTLARSRALLDCLASLDAQSYPNFTVVVVDNSACGAIHRLGAARHRFRLLENSANSGFGEAINQGFRLCPADYLAALNDDAVAHPDWLAHLVATLEAHPAAGMAASRILLPTGQIDSAGLLLARDGSSKQRGHLQPASHFEAPSEALCPSGCAALYRASMLSQIGAFASDFFLYCEDTDLGLRAQLAGFSCLYVPQASVTHAYSASAGAASLLKAWFVERNRLHLALRCLPASWLIWLLPAALYRYLCHLAAIRSGHGQTAQLAQSGGTLAMISIVLKAHLHLLFSLPTLLRQRRAIFRHRALSASAYSALLRRHAISLREVASL